ncbi:MAG: hypothetical protein AAFV53_36120 [Myxococcota bacterium]
MSNIVQCIEPDSLPVQISLELNDDEMFRVYLLSDASTSPGGLRSTILQKADALPPPEASLVFEVKIVDPGTGDPITMRVQRLGSSLNTDLVRPHMRSRVTPGTEVRSGSRLEVVLPDLRRVTFTLQLEAEIHQRATTAIGGGGVRHKQAVAGGDTAYFLYNTVGSVLTVNIQYVFARLSAWFTKLGVPVWVIPLVLTALLIVGGGAYFAYQQYQGRKAAEEQAEAAAEAMAEADMSAARALEGQLQCLAQQRALAQRLNDLKALAKAEVEAALQTTMTIGIALGEGGSRMGEDQVVSYDKLVHEAAVDSIVNQMQELSGVPSEAKVCLDLASVLVPDLPTYVLLWHPEPDLVCPAEYAAVEDGIDRAGRFGLSSRVVRLYGGEEFQAALIAAQGGSVANPADADPRMADRWSAATHAVGLRDVQAALLVSDAGNRVPVAPSQAHLWTLALWDAYNRMPSPADGVLDNPVPICITELMEETLRTAKPAEPGAPLLPNIVDVASGDEKIRPRPTAGCPWPEDAIQKGAQQALLAVAHTANYNSQGQN